MPDEAPKQFPGVMVSSTFLDLKEHRAALFDALSKQGLHPVCMEHSPSRPGEDVISASSRMVGEGAAYVALISHRYGQIVADPDGNQNGFSICRLEFEEAQRLGRPTVVFDMARNHPVTLDDVDHDPERRKKLAEYREHAKDGRIYETFDSLDDFKVKAAHAAAYLARHLAPDRPPQEKPTAPAPILALPRATLGTDFVGRDAFLANLRSTLTANPHAAVASFAVQGMGGIGKTCAAIEYAWAHRNDYTALLFVLAETPEKLADGLADLAAPLGLPEADAREAPQRTAAVLRWLAAHPGWLLILDNIDTPAALAAIRPILGRIAGGHVLLTGRLATFGAGIRAIDLPPLDRATATSMLLDRTPHRRKTPDDATAAAHLAGQTLDGLPLALEHAIAFIEHRRCTFADYAAALASTPQALLNRANLALTHYDRTIFRTWHAAIEILPAPARALLERLSFLAPDPVPLFLLEAKIPGAEAEDLDEARAALLAVSLIRQDGDALTVHRLVQLATRVGLSPEAARARLSETLAWLDAATPGPPDDVRTWPRFTPLAEHLSVATDHASAIGNPPPTATLLNELGLFFRARAEHRRAEPLYRRALSITEASLGPDHPNAAACLNNLAGLLSATNRLVEAEPLYRRALSIGEASLGPDHPNVATDLNNLAELLRATNRLVEAEPLYRRALSITEASLGPDHPNAASCLNNLANLLSATNRLAEAEPLYRRALSIGEASLGPDHPNVAIRLNNLAELLRATNRLVEAEPLYRRALLIDEASFGPDHPTVAIRLNNLAGLLSATNRLVEAEPLYRRNLSITEASLGPDHPNVATALNNLAELLRATNRLAEAEPLYRRAVEILLAFQRATSHPHPHRDAAIRNYTDILTDLGRTPTQIHTTLTSLGALPP